MQAGKPRPLTKPNHPWTNGQVERMNRTLKPAGERRSRARGERINIGRRSIRPGGSAQCGGLAQTPGHRAAPAPKTLLGIRVLSRPAW